MDIKYLNFELNATLATMLRLLLVEIVIVVSGLIVVVNNMRLPRSFHR